NQGKVVLGAGAVVGNAVVEPGAALQLNAAAAIPAGKTVTVNSSPTAFGKVVVNYTAGALPAITGTTPAGGSAAGQLLLGAAYAGDIDLNSVGDGTFFLGASANVTYAGTLSPGAGGVYRLGGGGAVLALSAALDATATTNRVVVGAALANGTGGPAPGTVVLLGANSRYGGGTVVNRSSTLVVGAAASAAAAGPLGTGPVT